MPLEARSETTEILSDQSRDALTCELRAPLTSIRAAAEILRDFPQLDEAEKSHFLDILLTEEARLENLVSHLEGPDRG
jgi:signal transduction histidine kinase